MKEMGMFGAVLAVMAVSGVAGATGWSEVNSAGTAWTQIEGSEGIKPNEIDNPGGGGDSSCPDSITTVNKDVNVFDRYVCVTVAAAQGLAACTVTGSGCVVVGAGATAMVTYCTEVFKQEVHSFLVTKRYVWSNFYRKCFSDGTSSVRIN